MNVEIVSVGNRVDEGRLKRKNTPTKQQRKDHDHEWEKGEQEDVKLGCKT